MSSLIKIGGYVPHFFYSQLISRPSYPTYDFTGQTVIVTGSNTGLGLEAARHVIRLGAAKVILAVRTVSKGEAAKEDVLSTTKVSKSVVEVWELDMGNTASITAFARRAKGLERLDAAILNAGLLTNNWNVVEGTESQIAVNTIGATLLATLLLPTLQKSAEKTRQRGKMTVVGSDLMYVTGIDEADTPGSVLEKLSDKSQASMGARYGLSKLLLYWSVQDLATRNPLSPESNVIVNVQTPGACKSTIFRDDVSAAVKAIMKVLAFLLQRTTEVGSRTLVHAVNPGLTPAAHGRFLMNENVNWEGLNVTSKKARRLAKKWNEELSVVLQERASITKQ